MIEDIRQTILTSDFIFILILLGFILVVTLLLLENRRDNIRLKEINQKVKDLIAGRLFSSFGLARKYRNHQYHQ